MKMKVSFKHWLMKNDSTFYVDALMAFMLTPDIFQFKHVYIYIYIYINIYINIFVLSFKLVT